MASLADRLGLTGQHELVIGDSFKRSQPQSLNSHTAKDGYHTVRYDFKPASVEGNSSGCMEVGSDRAVAVSLTSGEAGGQSTCYRGSLSQYQKECVLVIDRDTGQITLERLCDNIQVKKTRNESMTAARLGLPSPRPITPIDTPTKRASPLTTSVPGRAKSASAKLPGSMPLLGLEESVAQKRDVDGWAGTNVGVISEDSDSGSDDSTEQPPPIPHSAPPANTAAPTASSAVSRASTLPSMPSAHLFTDLQLSDSD